MNILAKAVLTITFSHGYGITADHIDMSSMTQCQKAMNEYVKDIGPSFSVSVISHNSTSIFAKLQQGREPYLMLKCLDT